MEERKGANLLRRLLPRETSFFDLFEEHAALVVVAGRELLAMHQGREESAGRIKELERKADSVVHRTIQSLHKIFITPFETVVTAGWAEREASEEAIRDAMKTAQ